MNFTQLQTPFLEEKGIRSVNFFNGRLLSGEDMTAEHAATIARLCRMGQAVGAGVAYGLEVEVKPLAADATPEEKARPILTVQSGLAVNRCGQTVKLIEPVDVALVRSRQTDGNVREAFGCCVPLKTGGRLGGDGVYLLTIAPDEAREGRAPVNGISTESTRCNSKYLVEGVQFNLVKVTPLLADEDFSDTKLLRNRVAYKCFGVEELAAFPRDPFGADLAEYGLMDKLRGKKQLSDCEVPLAIVYWTSSEGIGFVDMWAVRRRLTCRNASLEWLQPISDRRRAEGEAMCLEFQEQVESLRAGASGSALVEARQYFRFLPPVGIVRLATARHSRGFDRARFFAGMIVRRPLHLEGARWSALLDQSLGYPPIDLTSQQMIWQYVVRENVTDQSASGAPQPFLVFASGQLPYFAEPRFDVSRWGYSNFAIA